MKYRKVGKFTVSAVGYGAMGLSHGYGQIPEEKDAIALIEKAYDLGCTFFDTAEGYGNGHNESLLGKAVKPFRDKVVVATKLNLFDDNARNDLTNEIRKHLDASLERMGMDYVELFYLHRINPNIPLEEVAASMGELIKEGRIGGWGTCQATGEQIRAAHAVTPLDAIQSEYSMVQRMFEKDAIPACRELGIGFVPFSPLGAGFLSGKYKPTDSYKGDDVRRAITLFAPDNMKANQPILDMLHDFAEKKNATPAQISLAWMLHKEDFIVPIPGMRKFERIEENLGAADVELTEEEFQALENTLNGLEVHGERTDAAIMQLYTPDGKVREDFKDFER